jgi:hypothetical protein
MKKSQCSIQKASEDARIRGDVKPVAGWRPAAWLFIIHHHLLLPCAKHRDRKHRGDEHHVFHASEAGGRCQKVMGTTLRRWRSPPHTGRTCWQRARSLYVTSTSTISVKKTLLVVRSGGLIVNVNVNTYIHTYIKPLYHSLPAPNYQ